MSSLHSSIIREAQRLEALYPDDMILVFDTEGFYHYASPNREQIMGYTREETYGRHFSDFVTQDYVTHAELNLNNTVLTGESIESGVAITTKSGRQLHFRTVAHPITDPDTEQEFMIVRAHPA